MIRQLGPAQPVECGNPGHFVVLVVPQRAERPGGSQHPANLGKGDRCVEPMKRLADDYRVDTGIGQRDLFGRAEQCRHRGKSFSEFGEHRRARFDRGHVQPSPDQ
ncbi:hypothetical protein H4W33_005072 [Kibdelosporangium phytohabitans]|nr:hypothetical protein [Kibdelosporangium phytohabitans]